MKENKDAKTPLYLTVASVMAAVILVASVSVMPVVNAADDKTIEEQIKELVRQRRESEKKSGELKSAEKKLKTTVDDLRDQIAIIQVKIDSNTKEAKKIQRQIDEVQKKLTYQRTLLSANVRSMYMESDVSSLEMVASSKNLSDFVEKQEYRDRLKDAVLSTMSEIEGLRAELRKKKSNIVKILEEQDILKNLLKEKEGVAAEELKKTSQTRREFDAAVKKQSKRIAMLNAQRAVAHQALSKVDLSKLKSIKTVKRGEIIGRVGNTGYSFGPHLHLEVVDRGLSVNPLDYLGKNGWLKLPVDGDITQGYGEDNGFDYGSHAGVDFGANSGTPIKAVAGGRLYVGCTSDLLGSGKGSTGESYGYMAIIDHGNGLRSLYAHMLVPGDKPLPCNANFSYL